MILRRDRDALREGLEVEGGGEIRRRRAVDHVLGHLQHGRRAGRDLFGEGARRRHQLRRGHDAVHEPDARRLGGVDDVRGEDQLLGARQADDARQQPRAAAVGDEPDLPEELAEAGPVGGDDEIAAQRQVRAGADGVAVHHRDRRLGEVHQPEDHAIERLDARAALGGGVTPGAHRLDVAARAEISAGAGEDHHARRLVGLDLVEHARQLAAHHEIERVEGLRSIQGNRRAAAHGRLLSDPQDRGAMIAMAAEGVHMLRATIAVVSCA